MDTSIDDMQRKLDELGGKIAQRRRDLRTRGAFSDVHASYLHDLAAQHIRLANRLQSAASSPREHWEGTRDELARDYNALLDDFARMAENLDTEQMKASFEQ